MLLEDGSVGFSHSEETVIGNASGRITIEQLIEFALLECVQCYDGIFVWFMWECIDLVIIDFSVPHARNRLISQEKHSSIASKVVFNFYDASWRLDFLSLVRNNTTRIHTDNLDFMGSDDADNMILLKDT